ncbi:maltotransferase domain-containing protein [Streptacidiphilus cavernicola]|uniref:Alpha-1,4-glucan:maltose-1-phosphate maltosyltransferase n=1 Tax=Streptacidiphilus cavernicola TaxID=3342716 RepID=A0ABV6VQZ8_9ACTN
MKSTSPPPPGEGRLQITDVRPEVDHGRRPVRAVPGELFEVSATVFREGHESIAAHVLLAPEGGGARPLRFPLAEPVPGTDRFAAEVAVDREGDWTYRVEAWTDPVATWLQVAAAKVPARVDLELVFAEGALLLRQVLAAHCPADGADPAAEALVDAAAGNDPLLPAERALLERVEAALADRAAAPDARLAAVLDPAAAAVLAAHPLRELRTSGPELPLRVDRERALYGSWYEFFPRSEGAVVDPAGLAPPRSGTLRTAAERLAGVAAMGFDVVYLPPIHPIGRRGRKGPGNTATAVDGDPGSPWAVGADEGGHDAVHPELGTLADFDHFTATAAGLGLEVALDFALQCSPDHPWVRQHPQWFRHQLDGSIAYAENPPKKYQDIYPLHFGTDPEGILDESLRVLRHWMDHGVRIFRVDNPHTKPVAFWERLIAAVHATDPDVLFLAEAFTRPAMVRALARVGFHQSYSYFTWRETKQELADYLGELAGLDALDPVGNAAVLRPNLFVNTPDILPDHLRDAPRAAFALRAVLAATAGPSWGVYSGFELYESAAVAPGAQEYLDSEKYQYRPRDWAAAERAGDSLAPLITRLNQLRREHPALRRLRNLRVHPTDNDALLCFSKQAPAGRSTDRVIVVVNLDPEQAREGYVHLDLAELGLVAGEEFEVRDQLGGGSHRWRGSDYVRLDPGERVAHLFTVHPDRR